MERRTMNLLDEALGLNPQIQQWPLEGKVVVIQDCVETSGSFLLHHLIKRILASNSSNVVIFFAFSYPFSHYDRILRKLGCNLVAQRDSRFFFLDMLSVQCPDGNQGITFPDGFVALFAQIQKIIWTLAENNRKNVTIMIDDVSLMEVAAYGSSDHVLDFLHYCYTLTSDFGCSFVALNHGDIYSSMERPTIILQMEYLADVLIKTEPLATGLAADVHGQVTCNVQNKISNFQFMVKENGVEFFYPGSRS